MTATDFVESVTGFSRLTFVEQIKRFAWYLTCECQKNTFKAADISKCFDESRCQKPSSISPFLVSLTTQKSPFLLRKGKEFALSRNGRDLLDRTLSTRDASIAVDRLLSELPAKVPMLHEKVYLEEAIRCFRACAFRAAIVMTWNLAYDHLCHVVLTTKLADFNTQLPKSFPKADILIVKCRDDFMLLKEFQVIQVAKSANFISPNVNKILKEKLDRRNMAAHPSGVGISQLTAEEFILDLVTNVVLRIQ